MATYDKRPALAPDDELLRPAFGELGVDVVAASWSDPAVDWSAFDGVALRSCWDYHLRLGEFLRWLDAVSLTGTRVFNSPPLVRWNSDKRYLLDLAARGAAVVPTIVATPRSVDDALRDAIARGWSKVVVKPVVSASGFETSLFDDVGEAGVVDAAYRCAITGAALIQPYLDEIADGEWSLVFIDGEFSHATLKRARDGEFRVQSDYGGSATPAVAPAKVVRQAVAIIGSLPETPLYARVDGVVRNDELLLMELELIEPNLFFAHEPRAANRFARSMVRRVSRRR